MAYSFIEAFSGAVCWMTLLTRLSKLDVNLKGEHSLHQKKDKFYENIVGCHQDVL